MRCRRSDPSSHSLAKRVFLGFFYLVSGSLFVSSCQAEQAMSVITIQPGFVYLPNFLTEHEQERIVNIANELTPRFLLRAKNRYRIYDAVNTYPDHEFLSSLAQKALEACEDTFEAVSEPSTHLLFLRYVDKAKIGFHRDNDENDGIGLNPVISFSVGNSCTFMYGEDKKSLRSLRLNSGDVILFGNESRNMRHSVTDISQNTGPDFVRDKIGNTRLNLTFRYAPNIVGRENEFRVLARHST